MTPLPCSLYNQCVETLSSAIEKFNLDKNPLDQLKPENLRIAVSKLPPSQLKKRTDLTVKRTSTHPGTGENRLPYRIADAGRLIIDAVAMGSTYNLACSYAGISLGTFYNWLNRAEVILQRLEAELSTDPNSDPHLEPAEIIYLDFHMRLKQAEGEAVIGWLKVIKQAAEDEGKWQAAAWLLERRHPADYGKQTQVHQHHTKGQAVTVEEWKRDQKKRLNEANEVLAEFSVIGEELGPEEGARVLGSGVEYTDVSEAEDR